MTSRPTVRITILVDNDAETGLDAEHGLSLWVETEGKHVLFDTGQGGTLPVNARILGINPPTADFLVLSHGHYDHTGGLAALLQQGGRFKLYCHPGVVGPRYSVRNRTASSLQMPHDVMVSLDRFPQERMFWVQKPVVLERNIGLTGPIPRETAFENTGGPFYLDQAGWRPDPIDDDLALWIETAKGLIVCVGCAHAGLVNTLVQVQRLNKGMCIRAVIGGFHLTNATRSRLDATLDALRLLAPDLIVPCHCTGETAVQGLHDTFGNSCIPGAAGLHFDFEG